MKLDYLELVEVTMITIKSQFKFNFSKISADEVVMTKTRIFMVLMIRKRMIMMMMIMMLMLVKIMVITSSEPEGATILIQLGTWPDRFVSTAGHNDNEDEENN